MSQKGKDFQSKPKFGGKKFDGGSKGSGRPAGRGFSKKFEGDKKDHGPARERDGGGWRAGKSGPAREGKRDFSGKPAVRRDSRPFSGEGRPSRDGEGRGGFKPGFKSGFKKGGQGGGFRDRDREQGRDDRASARGGFGDKKPFRPKSRDDRGDRGEGARSFGGKKPFHSKSRDGERGERGGFSRDHDQDRGARGGFGDKKPFRARSSDERAPRGEGGSFGSKKPFHGKSRDGARSFDRARPADRGGDRGGFRKTDGKGPRREGANSRGYVRSFDRNRDYERPAPVESPDAAPASFETRERLKSGRPGYGAPSSAFLYGAHAVRAALLNPKRAHQRILCTPRGFAQIEEACTQARADGIVMPEITTVEKEDIERLLPRDAVHQDVLLDCQPLEEMFLEDVLISAPENARVLMLDQVTDPHNVGAILRSAAAFGATAVIVQKLHAPDVTGVLAKAASGAVEHMPLIRVVNLTRALEQLKEASFFCVGLDEDGKQDIAAAAPATGRVALVLGAEGDGLRRLVSETCDTLARLPTQGQISSLNVSNAAAVALYAVSGR